MKYSRRIKKQKKKDEEGSDRESNNSTPPSLEYYYKFIERNVVDESNRGGAPFETFQV